MSDSATNAAPAPKRQQAKHLAVIIAAAVVVVIVIAGILGYRVYVNAEHGRAVSACAAASDKVREAANEYNAIVNGDAADASAITAKQVKDSKTVDALAKALKEKSPEYEGCVADDTKGLNDAAGKLSQQESWYKTHAKSLTKMVTAVTDSKTAKDLDTAKADLKGTLDSAGKTLADSDGKVADNATRDSLKKTIDAAQKVYDKKDVTDPKAYSDEKGKLEKAVKVMNDSIQAKQAADEKAAQEAAAAQAAAEAQAQAQAAQQQAQSYSGYTGGSYSNYSNSGYTGGSYSNYSNTSAGGGYSAPQHNYTPSTNNGGGSSSGPVVTGGGTAVGGVLCGGSGQPACSTNGAE